MCRCSSERDPSKTPYTHVDTWADKYLDSGVSLVMDTAESAGSDYESDDSKSSVETVHHSYSYVPSDVEVRARVGSRWARAMSRVSRRSLRGSMLPVADIGGDI